MSSVKVIRALLLAHAPLMALVDAASVVAGTVPQGAPLPAVGITEISSNELGTVSNEDAGNLVRSRVQVTVLTKNYPAQKALIAAAKLASGTHTGIIAGFRVRSVLRLDVGPDLSDDDAGIYEQSRDFMVTFIEPN